MELIKVLTLGDINFGMPEDIELLNTPWGFYKFLEVETDAPRKTIGRAYKKKSRELHPDKPGGDVVAFQNLQRIGETLLDDGGELGEEHSLRRQYDEISSLKFHFSGHIIYKGERTELLPEIMLKNLQIRRKVKGRMVGLLNESPELRDLEGKLKRARSSKSKERLVDRIQEVIGELVGMTPSMVEESEKNRDTQRQIEHQETTEFFESLFKNPAKYLSKVLDVFYHGDNVFKFGQSFEDVKFGHVSHECTDRILRLGLFGKCYIAGFKQVHFKAPQANVRITDPHLTGIVQVIKGNVSLSYDASSYGNVIRIRAPEVNAQSGFTNRRDLYIPEGFATRNWWRRKPALDVIVREGTVRLTLTSPIISRGYNLTDIISNTKLDSYNLNVSNKLVIYQINKEEY